MPDQLMPRRPSVGPSRPPIGSSNAPAATGTITQLGHGNTADGPVGQVYSAQFTLARRSSHSEVIERLPGTDYGQGSRK